MLSSSMKCYDRRYLAFSAQFWGGFASSRAEYTNIERARRRRRKYECMYDEKLAEAARSGDEKAAQYLSQRCETRMREVLFWLGSKPRVYLERYCSVKSLAMEIVREIWDQVVEAVQRISPNISLIDVSIIPFLIFFYPKRSHLTESDRVRARARHRHGPRACGPPTDGCDMFARGPFLHRQTPR